MATFPDGADDLWGYSASVTAVLIPLVPAVIICKEQNSDDDPHRSRRQVLTTISANRVAPLAIDGNGAMNFITLHAALLMKPERDDNLPDRMAVCRPESLSLSPDSPALGAL